MKQQEFSRRKFLLSSLGAVVSSLGWLDPALAWTKPALKIKKGKVPAAAGPRALARQDWPPAIVPDHLGIDKGYCCFTDEFGRLAIVDMRKPADVKNPPHVISELSGLGRKVYDFRVVPGRAYCVVSKSTESGDSQIALVAISLTPVTDPVVIGTVALEKFAEVSCMTANGEFVCVGGTSHNNDNLVTIINVRGRGRQVDASVLATWEASTPVIALDYQDRNLAVLEAGQLEYVGLIDPRTPQTRATLKLDGEYKTMARFKSTVLLAGSVISDGNSSGGCVAQAIALEPTPRLMKQIALDPITTVLDSSAQKDRFLILGEGNSDRLVATVPFDKTGSIRKDQMVTLPKAKGSYSMKSSIALSNKTAFIASGWAGIEVLSNNGTSWISTYSYSIPRLPASGIAAWGDRVVISGGDLKLYDITEPSKPSLLGTTTLQTSLRSMVGAGSFVLCLTKDAVNLRKMDMLETLIASYATSGSQLCFDSIQQRAYVLREQAKKTVVTKLRLYSNDMSKETTYDLPATLLKASALAGSLATCGLNDVSLYNLGEKAELVGTRHFENLAIRDLVLKENCILASAVDQRSKGFLLILSRDQKDLKVIGTIDLPHDGAALAADATRAVVVGRAAGGGKDLACVVDITKLAVPKIMASLDAVEACSAVTIRDKVAIVAGRGIEILSLS